MKSGQLEEFRGSRVYLNEYEMLHMLKYHAEQAYGAFNPGFYEWNYKDCGTGATGAEEYRHELESASKVAALLLEVLDKAEEGDAS